MQRARIAAALLTISAAASCATPARVTVATPDPAKLDACPVAERAFPVLPALRAMTLEADAPVRLAGAAAPVMLKAGTELVLLDVVLDRDEATAVFVAHERGDKARCVSALLYVKDWAKLMQGVK